MFSCSDASAQSGCKFQTSGFHCNSASAVVLRATDMRTGVTDTPGVVYRLPQQQSIPARAPCCLEQLQLRRSQRCALGQCSLFLHLRSMSSVSIDSCRSTDCDERSLQQFLGSPGDLPLHGVNGSIPLPSPCRLRRETDQRIVFLAQAFSKRLYLVA